MPQASLQATREETKSCCQIGLLVLVFFARLQKFGVSSQSSLARYVLCALSNLLLALVGIPSCLRDTS